MEEIEERKRRKEIEWKTREENIQRGKRKKAKDMNN